jgi:YHS domain-containing protein
MNYRCFIPGVLIMAVTALMCACTETSQRPALRGEQERLIALGEKVFQEKECGKCHPTTSGVVDTTKKAPDLSSVFLAMDTLFVKKHLQFTELSAMPPIPLTPHEINALTQYIGVLHAQAHANPDLQNPDGICPICGAPLKIADAEANHLAVTYQGSKFYFECPDCKVVFERDPAWHSQSGYLRR